MKSWYSIEIMRFPSTRSAPARGMHGSLTQTTSQVSFQRKVDPMKLPHAKMGMMLLAILVGLLAMARADEPEAPPKPRDLGPPLVDNLKDLKQLGKFAAWLDP